MTTLNNGMELEAGKVVCPNCGGDGGWCGYSWDGPDYDECGECDGEGQVAPARAVEIAARIAADAEADRRYDEIERAAEAMGTAHAAGEEARREAARAAQPPLTEEEIDAQLAKEDFAFDAYRERQVIRGRW